MIITGTRVRGGKYYGGTASAVTTDEYFNLVSLLLPGNGTNGQTNNTFLDSSTNNFAITRNGNTTQGTFSPFSQTGWSNYFDGTGDYITFPSASRSNLSAIANTQMTWEFWIYTTNIQAITAYATGVFGNFSAVSANGRYGIGTSASGSAGPQNVYFQYTTSVSTLSGITTTQTLTLNSWNHIAITVDATTPASSTIKIFINGSGETFSSQDLSTHTTAPAIDFRLGEDLSGNQGLTGYISNFRVVRGSLVYTSNFTPPTAALTAIANTVVLTSQSNRFIDNSSNAFAITPNGNTAVQAFAPFDPATAYAAGTVGGSGYFDGTGDTLTAANDAAFQFGTGDFELSVWVYPTSYASARGIFGNGGTSAGTLFSYLSTSGKFESWIYGDAIQTPTLNVPLNAWTYLTVSRVGTAFKTFVNGVQDISYTTSRDISAQSCIVGDSFVSQSDFFNGYMADLRVRKGSGVSSVTVPTAPLTAIANTSLLLNYTNGGITDAAAKNVLETAGGAGISTAQSKFGGSSIYLDGTGDYLTFPSSQGFAMGTGDFTFEGWVYATGSDAADATGIFQQGTSLFPTSASNSLAVAIRPVSATVRWHTYAKNTSQDSTATVSLNTWYHFALVRNGTTTTLYIDGSSVITVTSDNTDYTGTFLGVGSIYGTVNTNWEGYINDLRITRGYARYTANFTAPTQAFPTQ